jgi:DNA-binding CsgD family transcriptional regulator
VFALNSTDRAKSAVESLSVLLYKDSVEVKLLNETGYEYWGLNLNQTEIKDIKNNTSKIAATYTKMATIFIDLDRIEEAKQYLTKALAIHRENKFIYGIAEVHNRFGVLYLHENNVGLAYYHVKRSVDLGLKTVDIDRFTSNLILLGMIKRMKNHWSEAEIDLKRGLAQAKEKHLIKYQLQAYEELITLKNLQEMPKEALFYSSQYAAVKEGISNKKKSKQTAYLQLEDQLSKKEEEVPILKASKITSAMVKATLIVSIFLVSLILWMLYKVSKKNRQLVRSEKRVAQNLEYSNLKEQELLLEINFKNKELASYALCFVQKNEILKEVQKKLQDLEENPIDKEAPIFKELNKTIQHHLTTDKDWDDFKMVFEQVHTDFYAKLLVLHPDLKTNDLKICSLIRLNLTIKETASILGISPASVKTARYRLRKKLQLEPNQEIISYLINLENNQLL